MADSWQETIWREWHHCQDPSYKRRLGRLVADLEMDWESKTAGRPTTTEIEKALFEACQTRPLVKSTWSQILEKLSEQLTQPDPVNSLVLDLEHEDWTIRFIARHTLAALGGEAVPALTRLAENGTNPQQLDLRWLLRCIELDTTTRLYPLMDRLVCPRCLVHCHAHWIDVPGVMPLVYYGCRNCGQSREFLEWTGSIVTILDTAMTEPFVEQDGALRGNWFLLRTLFDCDRVEIIRASDEEVERFAMQVGNDTDEVRESRYKKMQCVIDPACGLLENTMRVLKSMFGEVQHAPIP